MKTRVQKWGNSLAMRIPTAFAAEMHVVSNSTVEIALHEGKLIVSSPKRRKWTLGKLLEGVNRNNIHGEFHAGKPIGKEAW
jgi:antitoxin MazE